MGDFDYVIVGAGSAGCVLARRLTEDAGVRVLLLEAGGPDDAREIHIPAAFPKLFKGPCDWAYETEPEPHLAGRRLFWPRGKVLGGSSSINAMMYIRGNAWDYDRWRDAGNAGWGFSDVLPYFKKSVTQERGAAGFRGEEGPLWASDPRCVNPLSRAFVRAGVEVGLAANDDFNGPAQDGVGLYQATIKKGRRHSTAAAYLKPALGRANLSVETHAHAMRVIFDGRRATGVAYRRGGETREARAVREVVLAGGSINSPQLLLLSGVGPAAHLREHAIPVVADVAGVGGNLQDHLLVIVAYECTQPVSMAYAETLGNFLRYLLARRGPLASNIAEAGGFVRVQPSAPAPDIQIIFGPVFFLDHGFIRREGHGFSIGAVLLRPESRGRLSLASADPFAAPRIEANYLSKEPDLRVLVEATKLLRRIVGAPALAPYRGAEVWPGAEARDDDAIVDFIRQRSETLYHPVGTCAMGSGPAAVVDDRLRVRGVERLRVVDASVMPTIVSGNTNAPTIMIAEKGADLLREGK